MSLIKERWSLLKSFSVSRMYQSPHQIHFLNLLTEKTSIKIGSQDKDAILWNFNSKELKDSKAPPKEKKKPGLKSSNRYESFRGCSCQKNKKNKEDLNV